MVKFLLSQNAMSINHQGRDGHTGEPLQPGVAPSLCILFTKWKDPNAKTPLLHAVKITRDDSL